MGSMTATAPKPIVAKGYGRCCHGNCRAHMRIPDVTVLSYSQHCFKSCLCQNKTTWQPTHICQVNTCSSETVACLQGLVLEGGHGKLLLDKGLYPKSYATNVNEQFLHQLNLPQRTRTAVYDFSSSMPACTGTHSIVYSNISQQ